MTQERQFKLTSAVSKSSGTGNGGEKNGPSEGSPEGLALSPTALL